MSRSVEALAICLIAFKAAIQSFEAYKARGIRWPNLPSLCFLFSSLQRLYRRPLLTQFALYQPFFVGDRPKVFRSSSSGANCAVSSAAMRTASKCTALRTAISAKCRFSLKMRALTWMSTLRSSKRTSWSSLSGAGASRTFWRRKRTMSTSKIRNILV